MPMVMIGALRQPSITSGSGKAGGLVVPFSQGNEIGSPLGDAVLGVLAGVCSVNLGSQNLVEIGRLRDYVRQVGALRSTETIIREFAQGLCAHEAAEEDGANNFNVQGWNDYWGLGHIIKGPIPVDL